MRNTVTAVFEQDSQVERAADAIKKHGYDREELSIMRQHQGEDGDGEIKEGKKDNISGGLMTGGAIGGLAGVLAGAGTIAIPGLGILAAIGPIAGLFSGAAAGGLIGGLVDLGIPEKDSKDYERHLREGNTLIAVKSNEDDVQDLTEILKDYGGHDIRIH